MWGHRTLAPCWTPSPPTPSCLHCPQRPHPAAQGSHDKLRVLPRDMGWGGLCASLLIGTGGAVTCWDRTAQHADQVVVGFFS